MYFVVELKGLIIFFRDTVSPYVRKCIKTFTSDWVVVHRKFKARAASIARDKLLQDIPKQDFEVFINFSFINYIYIYIE